MSGRFTGLFSKWHCPKCHSILSRRDVKYRVEKHDYYKISFHMCLNCGNRADVKPVGERMVDLAANAQAQQQQLAQMGGEVTDAVSRIGFITDYDEEDELEDDEDDE